MKRSEDDETNATDREIRADGFGPEKVDESASAETLDDRASAFQSEADYSMSRGDELREMYDRKFYAPLQILMKDYRGILGLSILLLYILMGTVGVALIPKPTQMGPNYLPPFQDLSYILGTEATGKSMLRMIVHATPRMLQMMVAGAVFTVSMSVGVGVVAGYKRGTVDRVLMTITDTALNLPGLPLLLVLVAVLQPSNPLVIGLILSLNAWAGGARTLRAQVLQIRNSDHVEASRAMGASAGRNIQKNILPELMPLLMIRVMGSLRTIIYAAAGLYFLGVLPTNFNNWGVMLDMGASEVNYYTLQHIHLLLIPLITISLFGIGTIFLAQAFDRVFNPRLRAKHAKSLVGSDDGAEDSDAAVAEVMIE